MQIKQALLVAALVLVARAQARAVVQEDVKGVTTILQDEARDDPFFDPNPQYDFAYRIHDAETGDAKDQKEQRHGDAVQGSYSVVDPDGTLRVVKYTADDINGFNAVVSLTPGHAKPYVPPIRQRAAVLQHHVDIPVPVQHHIVPPQTAAEIVANRRVQVEQTQRPAGTVVHQHMIQHPAGPVGLHHDPLPLPATQQVPSTLLQVPVTAHGAQHIVQQVHQEQHEAVQLIPQQELSGVHVQDIQSLKGLQEVQNIQEIQGAQAIQEAHSIQQSAIEQQQQSTFLQEQDNKLQQGIIPQVIEVRHSVQQMMGPQLVSQQRQQQQLQLRSLDSDEQQQMQLQLVPHQRTLAVYRTSPSFGGQSGNFITFNSPYAQYTIS